MYNDEYATCFKTYVTLRIYFEKMNSEELTKYLEIKPTKSQNKGERSKNNLNLKIEHNGWFLSSEESVKSKDFRRHIDCKKN